MTCQYPDIAYIGNTKEIKVRRFHFERIRDVSGTSGCGNVADGVLFDDGQVVVHWIGCHSSINVYHSLEDVEWIHGHQGSTKIVFDDPEKSIKLDGY